MQKNSRLLRTCGGGRMRGSFSIEASIVLISVFAVFTSFAAYIRTVRAESIIRSALDMTAVEISTLCYPASRICEEISAAGKEGYDGEEKSGFLKYPLFLLFVLSEKVLILFSYLVPKFELFLFK